MHPAEEGVVAASDRLPSGMGEEEEAHVEPSVAAASTILPKGMGVGVEAYTVEQGKQSLGVRIGPETGLWITGREVQGPCRRRGIVLSRGMSRRSDDTYGAPGSNGRDTWYLCSDIESWVAQDGVLDVLFCCCCQTTGWGHREV